MNSLKSCKYGTMIFNVNDEWVGRSLAHYGEYSDGEVSLFKKLIKPGDTVLDVGANIGALTLPLSRIVGPNGRVIAFEPQASMYYMLCGNIAINSITNTECLQHALGKTRGQIKVPVVNTAKPGNFGAVELNKDYPAEVQFKSVQMLTLDGTGISHCDFIKIDVEGMELDVLEGAKDTIAKLKPYLYVENDRPEHCMALLRKVADFGYKIYLHRPHLYNPNNYLGNSNNILRLGDGPVVSINLLGVPPERFFPDLPTIPLESDSNIHEIKYE